MDAARKLQMEDLGRYEPVAARRSGPPSQCAVNGAPERPVPTVKRPFMTGSVHRLVLAVAAVRELKFE